MRHRMAIAAQVVRTVAVYVFVGALLTVATVWAQALLLPEPDWRGQPTLVGRNLGWPWPPPAGWPEGAKCVRASPWGGYFHSNTPRENRIPANGGPIWIYPEPPSNEPRAVLSAIYNHSNDFHMTEHRYGWPRMAMRRVPEIWRESLLLKAEPHDEGTLSHRMRNGLKLSANWREVPLAPAWPGFAIHTAFWGFLALGSRRGVSVLRYRRRLNACLCTKCRYPVSALTTCPECGTVVGRKLASPATA